MTLGFSDFDGPDGRGGVYTSGCTLQGESASVGYVEPGDVREKVMHVHVNDGQLVLAGRWNALGGRCDSISYITIVSADKAGWLVESKNCGPSFGAEDANCCRRDESTEKTYAECQEHCKNTLGCDGITFQVDNNRCFLRHKMDLTQCNASSEYISAKNTEGFQCDSFQTSSSSVIINGQLGQLVDYPLTCQTMCMQDGDCVGYIVEQRLENEEYHCWLLSESGNDRVPVDIMQLSYVMWEYCVYYGGV